MMNLNSNIKGNKGKKAGCDGGELCNPILILISIHRLLGNDVLRRH
jgi:hypothetical protein